MEVDPPSDASALPGLSPCCEGGRLVGAWPQVDPLAERPQPGALLEEYQQLLLSEKDCMQSIRDRWVVWAGRHD